MVVKLGWTADGSTETTVNASGQAYVNGKTYWIRATLDVDNGGGGYTVAFSTSVDDGTTWVSAGGTTTSAGTTAVHKSAYNYEVGSRAGGSAPFNGRVYRAELRDGIAGPNMFPVNIDAWRQVQGNNGSALGGSPTLYLVNGSESGQNIAYFSAEARLPKMIPKIYRGAYILSTGHNEFHATSDGSVRAWIDAVKTRVGAGRGYAVMQNPRLATAGKVEHQKEWVASFREIAISKGLTPIDVYSAFINSGIDLTTLVNADGIHPTQGANSGSSLWADTEYPVIFGI